MSYSVLPDEAEAKHAKIASNTTLDIDVNRQKSHTWNNPVGNLEKRRMILATERKGDEDPTKQRSIVNNSSTLHL